MERKCRLSVAPAGGEVISHLFCTRRSRTLDIKKNGLIRTTLTATFLTEIYRAYIIQRVLFIPRLLFYIMKPGK